MTHICVGNQTIIGSDNGLSSGRRQAIIWTNAGILLIRPLGTNFSEISIKSLTFSFTKMLLKVSSAKWRPFCLGLNVLTQWVKSLTWAWQNPSWTWKSYNCACWLHGNAFASLTLCDGNPPVTGGFPPKNALISTLYFCQPEQIGSLWRIIEFLVIGLAWHLSDVTAIAKYHVDRVTIISIMGVLKSLFQLQPKRYRRFCAFIPDAVNFYMNTNNC